VYAALKLLVYAALSYEGIRLSATRVCGLKLYLLMRLEATIVWGFKLLVFEILSYDGMRP
jgi:hypothetical protein